MWRDLLVDIIAACVIAALAALGMIALLMIMGCDTPPETKPSGASYYRRTVTVYPDGTEETEEEESAVHGPAYKGFDPKLIRSGGIQAGPDGAKTDLSEAKGQKPSKKLTSLSGIYYASAGVMVLGAVMCKFGGFSVGIPIILAGLGIAAAFRFMETYPWVLAVAACGLAVAVGPAMWRAYRAKAAEATNRDLVSAIAHAEAPASAAVKSILDKKTGKAKARLRREVNRAKRELGMA